jgi:GNAT superfamily N-acetyltransferase
MLRHVVDIPDLEIRRYRSEDSEAVWLLHNLALDAVDAHAGNGPWDDDLHAIEDLYLAAGGEFLVGLVRGELVAMGALCRSSDARAEIKRMRVHPNYQGQRFGTLMLERLEERARDLGYTELHLDTTTAQSAARALYSGQGYRDVGRASHGRFELVLFEKKL